MKIPIQLIPQGVIPRDPNFTFRLQRLAPVVVAAQAVVSTIDVPVYLTAQLLANFNGSGDLSTYLADTGQSFTLVGDGALSDYVLDGSGHVVAPDGATNGEVTAPVTVVSNVYSMLGKASVLNYLGGGGGWAFNMAAIDSATGTFLVEWFVRAADDPDDGFIGFASVNRLNYDPPQPFEANAFPVAIEIDVPFELRFVVTPSGTKFLLDGVVVKETTAVPEAFPDQAGFLFTQSGGGTFQAELDSIEFDVAL